MNQKTSLRVIVILILSFWQVNLYGQNPEDERKVYLMHAKQFYGSGAKMDLMINGKLFCKIKNGERLIITSNLNDTLNIQIVYPLIKRHKSKVLQILPNSENEVYIDLFYQGEGYNPLKHDGVINPSGGTPDFRVEKIGRAHV